MEKCKHENIRIDDDIRNRGNGIKFGVYCEDCNAHTKDSWYYYYPDSSDFEWSD